MTKEMKKYFNVRTKNHIKLVEKYINKISDLGTCFANVKGRALSHDMSKFNEPEYIPYVYITWMYKCKREGINWKMPDGMQSKVNAATIHHIVTNKHHPEYWDDDFDAFTKFNAGNRDCVPNEMVNGTSMPAVSLMEMIADWCAVSEERGTNPMDWLELNVNKRWKFTNNQIDFMKALIKKIWNFDGDISLEDKESITTKD